MNDQNQPHPSEQALLNGAGGFGGLPTKDEIAEIRQITKRTVEFSRRLASALRWRVEDVRARMQEVIAIEETGR